MSVNKKERAAFLVPELPAPAGWQMSNVSPDIGSQILKSFSYGCYLRPLAGFPTLPEDNPARNRMRSLVAFLMVPLVSVDGFSSTVGSRSGSVFFRVTASAATEDPMDALASASQHPRTSTILPTAHHIAPEADGALTTLRTRTSKTPESMTAEDPVIMAAAAAVLTAKTAAAEAVAAAEAANVALTTLSSSRSRLQTNKVVRKA